MILQPKRNVEQLISQKKAEDAFGVEYTLEEYDWQEFQRLEEALGCLDSDNFGYCESCGEPIEISRLLIIPETSLCSACAAEQETRGEPG